MVSRCSAISVEQLLDFVAGIDQHAFARRLVGEHEAVLHERRRGTDLDQHGSRRLRRDRVSAPER